MNSKTVLDVLGGRADLVKGDVLSLFDKGAFEVLAHGCNCFKLMGAGVALQIARCYPQAMEVDAESPLLPDERLGTCSYAMLGQCRMVANMYSQFEPGRCDPISFKEAFTLAAKELFGDWDGYDIGMPLIGCGIAGQTEETFLNCLKNAMDETEFSGRLTIVELDAV